MKCRICQRPCKFYAKKLILNKYAGDYFRCTECYTIQVRNPHWLEEAYKMILPPRADPAEPTRNANNHLFIKQVINANAFGGPFLDYGCGKGILVNLMQENGFDYYGYDKYTTPGVWASTYDIITAFEVIEHMTDPMVEIRHCLEATDNFIFSTDLHGGNPSLSWPYFAAAYGQHVTLYTLPALKFMAKTFNRRLYSKGGMHALSKIDMSPWLHPVF